MLDLAQYSCAIWTTGLCIGAPESKTFSDTKEEALGRISHDVLKTDFGVPLAQIERALEKEGNWGGELVRRARDGSQLVVELAGGASRNADETGHLGGERGHYRPEVRRGIATTYSEIDRLGMLSGGSLTYFNNTAGDQGQHEVGGCRLRPDLDPVQQSLAAIGKVGRRAGRIWFGGSSLSAGRRN